MKKIVILLAVLFFDLILLQAVSAFREPRIIPAPLFPYLILFLTLITTIFLFYEDHIERVHQSWHKLYTKKVENMFEEIEGPMQKEALAKSMLLRKKEAPSLALQYQQMQQLIDQIRDLQSQGKSEEEIILIVKEQRWDPHVIYLALGRANENKPA
jgi:hypothetical protein